MRGAALILALASSAGARPSVVHFKAQDGVRLCADYARAVAGKRTLILLHGVASGRGEWSAFLSSASRLGLGGLAMDFRGHGDSGGPRHASFGDDAWSSLSADVDGAVAFLRRQGVPPADICLVGASIGANLALRAAIRNPGIRCAALLSPGMDYRGVRVGDDVPAFRGRLLLAASSTDPYALQTVQWILGNSPAPSPVALRAPFGHGVQMFDAGLAEPLLRWLTRP